MRSLAGRRIERRPEGTIADLVSLPAEPFRCFDRAELAAPGARHMVPAGGRGRPSARFTRREVDLPAGSPLRARAGSRSATPLGKPRPPRKVTARSSAPGGSGGPLWPIRWFEWAGSMVQRDSSALRTPAVGVWVVLRGSIRGQAAGVLRREGFLLEWVRWALSAPGFSLAFFGESAPGRFRPAGPVISGALPGHPARRARTGGPAYDSGETIAHGARFVPPGAERPVGRGSPTRVSGRHTAPAPGSPDDPLSRPGGPPRRSGRGDSRSPVA
jgi:hypothetical protein